MRSSIIFPKSLYKLLGYLANYSTFRTIVGSYCIKMGSTLILLIVNIVLARLLGAEDLGLYKYVMAWIALLSVPSMLGLGQLIIREVASESKRYNWGLVKGIISWSQKAVLISSMSIIVLSLLYLHLFLLQNTNFQTCFIAALPLLPLMSLLNVYQTSVRGLNKIIQGQVLEQLIRQIIFLFCLTATGVFFPDTITPFSVILINVAITSFIVLCARFQLNISLPVKFAHIKSKNKFRYWSKCAVSFLLNSGLNVLNQRIDIIMLGALIDMRSTGIYAIASEFGALIIYIAIAANTTIAPKISELYSLDKFESIQKLITKTTGGIIVATLIISISMILLGKFILNIFGADFIEGYPLLITICIGKSFHSVLGLMGMLFNMTGNEKFTALSSGFGTFCNFLLNLFLIPLFGTMGAAIATIIGGLVTVGFLFFNCKRVVGIAPFIFKFNLNS